MKTTELMLGDYVKLNTGKIVKVDAIHNRKIGYHNRPDKLTWVFEGQFMPIEVTRELLEQNGCEFNQFDSWCWITNNTYWENSKIYTFDDTYICEGMYVHQLQHFLKLNSPLGLYELKTITL